MLMPLLASVLVPPHPAEHILGYLDPGTGSLLLQATLAALLTVPFILRSKIQSVIWRVRGRGRAPAEEDHAHRPV